MIELQKISKKIGKNKIINSVSLSVHKGHVFALLGPNGSGKTTLIRLMLGVLKADVGQIYLFGKLLSKKNRSELLSQIGVQNDGNVYETLTIRENLMIFGKIYGLNENDIKLRIDELGVFFQLERYMENTVGSLSKGNRQKVLLARAILHNPKILILDEPTSGLDPEAIDEFYSLLQKLKEEYITIVMCTHYLYGLTSVVDSVGILKEGKLIASGTVEALRIPFFKVTFKGTFRKDDVLELKKYGIIEGKMESDFSLQITDRIIISKIINKLVENGNLIEEVTVNGENIKNIYFRLIGGEQMNSNRIKAVLTKEFIELIKDRNLIISLLIVPIIFSIVLPSIILSIGIDKLLSSSLTGLSSFLDHLPMIKIPVYITEETVAIYSVLSYFFLPLFMLIPVMLSTVLASNSLIGEKEKKTLEGILYTPITIEELILGKVLGAVLPSIVITIVFIFVYCIIVNIFGWRYFMHIILPNSTWIIATFLLCPLLVFESVLLVVGSSQFLKSSKSAQGIAMIVIMPIICIAVSQSTGILILGFFEIAMIIVVLLIVIIITYLIIIKIFDAEKFILN